MRLSEMAEAFVAGRPKRGLLMAISVDEDSTVLKWQASERPIATIYNRGDDGSYKLIIHSKESYSTRARNRIDTVFWAIAKSGHVATESIWTRKRYAAMSLWGYSHVYDMRTEAKYKLVRDMQFYVSPRGIVLDYERLEEAVAADTGTPKVLPKAKNNANLTSREAIAQAMALANQI